jgi:hypothetical protein
MGYDAEKARAFKETLETVAGQALDAAGYQLEADPMQLGRGMVRYVKPLPELGEDIYGFIEWQLLAFEQSSFYRFRIQLLRNQGKSARTPTGHPLQTECTLAWVIWHVYQARILPSDDEWWSFRYEDELPQLIANAGRLLFGYGVPWLEMHSNDAV